MSFTTEEIYRLINKEDENSIHLKNFIKIPENWKNEELNSNWEKIKKIRDKANIAIESQRANKTIGSSLEADIQIKVKDTYFNLAKKNDFSEICITSLAKVIQDNNMEKDIEVTCKKAEGEKCSVCWKISKTSCEKHGHLTN